MKRYLATISFIILFLSAGAQRYNFKEYSVPDGLIHSTVTSITEDQRGYLWLGTYDGGISQFDGKTFINYSEGEIFAGYYIRDIKAAPDGTIWIASNGGLAQFDGQQFIAHIDTTIFLSRRIRSLLFDSQDKFWIGTNKGINIVENDSVTAFKYNHLLPKYGVISMIEAANKTIYIGTVDGVYTYKNDALDSIKTFGSDSISLVYSLKEDSKGRVWFGTHYGIGLIEGDKVSKVDIGTDDAGTNIIESIEEDRDGNIWFATRGGGALIYDGSEFKKITDQNGLSSNGLFSLYRDSNNIMWIGGGGLNKYFGEGFHHISTNEGLVHEVVFPIKEDKNGNIWLGTEGGLSYLDSKTGKITNYTKDDGLSDNVITSILETKNGDVWVTTQTGLNKLVNGKFVQHPKYDGVELWTIHEDDQGDIWIGTSYGLAKERRLNETLFQPFDKSSLIDPRNDGPELPDIIRNSYASEFFSKANGLVDDGVYDVKSDEQGNLWVGTMYSGVFKYSNGRFEKFDKENGLLSNNIIKMKPDGKGGMWIGTNTGLSHYTNGQMHTYTRDDGLWMDMIFNIIVDEDNVWIGGSKGIQKLTFDEEWNITEESKFGQYEGFTSIETNDGGGIKDSKGNLWFGTIRGATIVDPNRINYESSLTRIHITNIKLFFEDVDWSEYAESVSNWYKLPKNLLLPSDLNQLTFEYAGINLKVPEKIRYQWKLEGFDQGWSPPTDKREANYTNIPPGEHTFLVKASNEHGVWNPTPASFQFQVDYPIYQRWWFILLCIAAGITVIYGVFAYRLNNVRKITMVQQMALETERKMVESERKALRAQINPHFIFNVLNSIQYYIQDNEPLVASRYLSKFAKLMRTILDNSKSSSVSLNDELEALKLYMDLEVLRSEYKFEYDISIDESIDTAECFIPPMLIQPFIENSIRHGIMPSPINGRIQLDLSLDNGIIKCIIEDNGIGINQSAKSKSNDPDHISSGMQITKDRLELINSQRDRNVSIEIEDISETNPDATGTRVTIFIPIE